MGKNTASATLVLFKPLLNRHRHLNAQAPQYSASDVSTSASRTRLIESIEPELTFAQEIDLLLLPTAYSEALDEIDWVELRSRLSRLDPIFLRLQRLTISAESARRDPLPFQNFDQQIVLDILLTGFVSVLATKAALQRYPQTADEIVRQAKGIIKLGKALREVFPDPGYQQSALKAMFLDCYASSIARDRTQMRQSAQCPTVGLIITALTTYFWRCQAIKAHYPASAKVYQIVGEIIESFTAPSCPTCEHSHTFQDWRWVREWDKDKGCWETCDLRAKARARTLPMSTQK